MNRLTLAVVLLAAAQVGCGGPSPPPEMMTPHGGTLVDLPGGRGFIEALKRSDPSKEGQAQILLYFLDSSRRPMAQRPTSARLKFQADKATSIDLAPGEGASLASVGFPDPGEIAGVLTTSIDGQAISVPILIR